MMAKTGYSEPVPNNRWQVRRNM